MRQKRVYLCRQAVGRLLAGCCGSWFEWLQQNGEQLLCLHFFRWRRLRLVSVDVLLHSSMDELSCADGARPFFSPCARLALYFLTPSPSGSAVFLMLCLHAKCALVLSGMFLSVSEFSQTDPSVQLWGTSDPLVSPLLPEGFGFHCFCKFSLLLGTPVCGDFSDDLVIVNCIYNMANNFSGCHWIRSSGNRLKIHLRRALTNKSQTGIYGLQAAGRNVYHWSSWSITPTTDLLEEEKQYRLQLKQISEGYERFAFLPKTAWSSCIKILRWFNPLPSSNPIPFGGRDSQKPLKTVMDENSNH